MITHRRLPTILFALLVAVLPVRATAAEVHLLAAASLADALKELTPAYETASGDTLRLNLGASSALARQIKEGAPADVFFSADEAKVDDLARAGLIVAESRGVLLSNTLVIIVPLDGGPAISAPADLAHPDVRRIALAETQTVPAGIYAREYLQKAGLWEQLSAKVVATENVRATLAAVEAGNADAGIVYRTDALISKKVRVAHEVAAADGPRIAYPVAVLRDAKNPEAAARLTAFLASDPAHAAFIKYGFLLP